MEIQHRPDPFSSAGRLLDGQHHIAAVMKAGIGIEVLAVFGLPDESFLPLIPAVRSGGDVLSTLGYRLQHAGLRYRLGLALLIPDFYLVANIKPPATKSYRNPPRPPRPCRIQWSVFVTARGGGGLIPGSILLAALLYLFSRSDETLALAFIEQLHSGEGLNANDGVYWLRKRLQDNWRIYGEAAAHRHRCPHH